MKKKIRGKKCFVVRHCEGSEAKSDLVTDEVTSDVPGNLYKSLTRLLRQVPSGTWLRIDLAVTNYFVIAKRSEGKSDFPTYIGGSNLGLKLILKFPPYLQ